MVHDFEKSKAQQSDVISRETQDVRDDLLLTNFDRIEDVEKPDHEALQDILSALLIDLDMRNSVDDEIPSLLLLGPPGVGITEVVKTFAKKNDMQIKILEINSIYPEALSGFPIVSKDVKDETVVNLVASDLLPPEGDKRKWIVFFDEFNRNAKKMGLVMNFIHSGSIGSTYNLPVKTIVIAAGNLGKKIDFVDVEEMDAATRSRFRKTLTMDYDWSSWLEYVDTKDGVRKVGDGVIETGLFSPTIRAWITNKMRKYLDKNAGEANNFKMTYTSSHGKKSHLNPRDLTDVEEDSKTAAIRHWDNNTLVGNKTKEYYQMEYDKKIEQNKISKKEFPSAMIYYYALKEKYYVKEALDDKIENHNFEITADYLANVRDMTNMLRKISSDRIVFNWTLGGISEADGRDFLTSFVSADGIETILGIKNESYLKKKIKEVAEEVGTLKETNEIIKNKHNNNLISFVSYNVIRYFIDIKVDGIEEYAGLFISALVKSETWDEEMNKGNSIVVEIVDAITEPRIRNNPFLEIAKDLVSDNQLREEKHSSGKSAIERIRYIIRRYIYVHKLIFFVFSRENCDFIRKDEIGTASVHVKNNKIIFTYNEEFINGLTNRELNFLILHEFSHILFKHISTRGREISEISRKSQKAYNIACDAVINEFLINNVYDSLLGYDMIESGITLDSDVPGIEVNKIADLLETEEVYSGERLSEPLYKFVYRIMQENIKYKPKIGDIVVNDKNGDEDYPRFDNHDEWGKLDSKTIDRIMKRAIEKGRRELKGNKGYSSKSGNSILDTAMKNFLRVEFDVNKILDRLNEFKLKISEEIDSEDSYTMSIFNPVTQQGPIIRPATINVENDEKKSAILIIGVDTSGSIGKDELMEAFGYMNTIAEQFKTKKHGITGDTYYICWDTVAYPPMKKWEHVTKEEFGKADVSVHGGGGTNVESLFKILDEKFVTTDEEGEDHFVFSERNSIFKKEHDKEDGVGSHVEDNEDLDGVDEVDVLLEPKTDLDIILSEEPINDKKENYISGEVSFLDDEVGVGPFLLIYTDGEFPKPSISKFKLFQKYPGNIMYVLKFKENIKNLNPRNFMYYNEEDVSSPDDEY